MNGDNIISPMMYGGAQERNMRAGTENIIGITGMAVALEKAIEQKEERADHIKKLNRHMRTRLDELAEIVINGTNQIDNILSVSFPATERVDMLMLNLDISRISASSGSACSSGIEHDSHVLQHIGHSKERKTIRFSFSHFNTIEEIDYVIEKLKKFTPIKEAYNN
jgi:cysteine desulfurase